MIDDYKHIRLRQQLVETLKEKGIKDNHVLMAINKVPRHLFLDSIFEKWAYKDVAFPIEQKQTISQPFTVALQSSLLTLDAPKNVLEIGTGSGYQAAVLSEMGMNVYTIERQENLYKQTGRLLSKLGYNNIKTFFGDGYKGLPDLAPFDRVIVTAGAQNIPSDLLKQLQTGGIAVIPIGNGGKAQRMIRFTKISDTQFQKEDFGDCSFVPFLEGTVKKEL